MTTLDEMIAQATELNQHKLAEQVSGYITPDAHVLWKQRQEQWDRLTKYVMEDRPYVHVSEKGALRRMKYKQVGD